MIKFSSAVNCLAVCLFTCGAHSAHANYVPNYARWQALSTAQKGGYVMGMFDWALTLPIDPSPYDVAHLRGRVACAKAVGLTDTLLVQAIEWEYANNPNSWGEPVAFQFHRALMRICLSHMNHERQKAGLPLLSP